MRINNNMSAVITNKQLFRTESKLTQSMERLSSGLKINKSKDNPSGMAISNKMQAQIDALSRASDNASDGVSVIQIADGALNETVSILQRMRELSVQAANGTNSLSDKQAIQAEIEQLTEEVNRISKDTEYNSKSLLDGSLDTRVYTDNGMASRIYISDDVNPGKYEIQIETAATKAQAQPTGTSAIRSDDYTTQIGVSGTLSINGYTVDISAEDTYAEVFEKLRTGAELGEAELVTDAGDENLYSGFQAGRYGSEASLVLKFSGKSGTTTEDFANALGFEASDTHCQTDSSTGEIIYTADSGKDAKINVSTTGDSAFSSTATVSADGNKITITDKNGFSIRFQAQEGFEQDTVNNTTDGKIVFEVTDIGNMTIHIGANEKQNMKIRIPDMSAENLYIDEVDVTTVKGADRAIETFDDAIAMVSEVRSKLGAYENRLESASNSLDAFEENMTGALSRLTDVDMAEEMTTYTQYNVLEQAGISVLSQANDLPQQVLQLLS